MTELPPSRPAIASRRPDPRARHALTLLAAGLALAAGAMLLVVACTAPPPDGQSGQSGPETVRVSIKALTYEPASLEVAAGSSVTWVSEDVAAHDVTADDGSFASGTMQQGDAFTLAFDEPGSWAYTCTLHPEMTGVIRVR